jgi:hypothetical protein
LVVECSIKIKRSDFKRFKHIFMQALTTMDKNNLMEVMDLNGDHDLNLCDRCMYGKHQYPISFEWGFSSKGHS